MKTARLILLVSLTCAATALALDPPPDGGYANQNTAEGEDALFSVTTGFNNTALGYHALNQCTTGDGNVAVGTSALELSRSNEIAAQLNTAVGAFSLALSTTGQTNTAVGNRSLGVATTASQNVAIGYEALFQNRTGNLNIAIGYSAGLACRGSNNIMIGNGGLRHDVGAIRIGTAGFQTSAAIAGISGVTVPGGVGVVIDSNGNLGTITSSARYKEAIEPMGEASDKLLSLQPVRFRYKKELDPKAIPQFGLVAEQVAKVDPDLVARDKSGKPYTVRYEAVNAMLLNEFLKEHRKVEKQGAEITELKAMIQELKATMEKVERTPREIAATDLEQ